MECLQIVLGAASGDRVKALFERMSLQRLIVCLSYASKLCESLLAFQDIKDMLVSSQHLLLVHFLL